MTQGHPASAAPLSFASTPQPSVSFTCDGRKYCSQMTSCQEATYFLKNCPGVKMDGNHDGVPCEQQWCKP
ncbi:excalibur calcium-binding domain-containing protein [Variovorax paradoxus]|uniref:excalibur calcium-binding domain-containing protein n=1 Tax=Variovorax paradoxus TaxID=34073 RepID=UPI00399BAA29